jgi:hypothetical protein
MIFKHPLPHFTETAVQAATNDTPIWAKVLGVVLIVAIGVMLLLCGWEQAKATAILEESEAWFRRAHPSGLLCRDGTRLMPTPEVAARRARRDRAPALVPTPTPALVPMPAV